MKAYGLAALGVGWFLADLIVNPILGLAMAPKWIIGDFVALILFLAIGIRGIKYDY